jgi:tocopherol cyclase
MVSVHYNGTFFEAVPWKGEMDWNVSTWGYWGLRGECFDCDNPFAVEVTYECVPEKCPGLVFRAPTPDEGMVYFCRDTFDATCTLSLWELEVVGNGSSNSHKYSKKEPPLIDRATSRQGGAEIGGGPWWTDWKAKSRLKRIIKILLSVPSMLVSLGS